MPEEFAVLDGELVDGAYGRYGEVDRFLQTVLHVTPDLECSVSRMDGVSTGADVVGIA